MLDDLSRYNARNTFQELLKLGVIPVVNENDTVATHEIEVGDNDRLSAIVAAITGADLLILLSDIDGLFTDDPNTNADARFIPMVDTLSKEMFQMGKATSGSSVGTGGMYAKLLAAQIATKSGAAMVIANGENLDVIEQILAGDNIGTLFIPHKSESFDIVDYLAD
jgi:glutamate 5-kinase